MQAFHDNAEDAVRIAEVFDGMEKAFHDKDAAKFDGHFTDDAVFVTPAGAVFRGWPEIYAYHKENLEGLTDDAHAEMRAHYTVTDADFLDSDTAVVHTRQTLTTPQWDVVNVGTSVLTKKDGAWRICALQNNNVARTW